MSELTLEEKRELKNARERANWARRRMKRLEELGLDPNRPVRADGKRGLPIGPSKRDLPAEFKYPKEGESEEAFKKRRQKEVARRYNEKHKERLGIERRAHYAATQPHQREVKRKWEAANPEKRKQYGKEFSERNPDRLQKLKKWREDNPELAIQASKNWYKNNPHMNAAYASERRAAEKQQCPPWANWKEITKIFKERDTVSSIMKSDYHVDHIVPLRSKIVSGLHIHTNMQILPGDENVKKRARLDDAYVISLMKRDWEALS